MRIYLGFVFLVFMGCASKDVLVSEKKMRNLKDAVYKKNIAFEGRSASPLRFGNNLSAYNTLPPGSNQAFVNLANIYNYVKIYKDSISMDLPFYGEQRIINAYSSDDNSLIFHQPIDEKTIVYDPKKKTYTLKLLVKGRQESLRISYTLHPNQTAQMVVNSTHRNAITYRGDWTLIKE